MNRAELAEHIRLFQRSGIDVRPFLVDYHMKLPLPFASLVLSLLAAPLSLWGGRHGWVFGLGASIGLAFLYYTLMALFRSLGTNGVLPPWWPCGPATCCSAWSASCFSSALTRPGGLSGRECHKGGAAGASKEAR